MSRKAVLSGTQDRALRPNGKGFKTCDDGWRKRMGWVSASPRDRTYSDPKR